MSTPLEIYLMKHASAGERDVPLWRAAMEQGLAKSGSAGKGPSTALLLHMGADGLTKEANRLTRWLTHQLAAKGMKVSQQGRKFLKNTPFGVGGGTVKNPAGYLRRTLEGMERAGKHSLDYGKGGLYPKNLDPRKISQLAFRPGNRTNGIHDALRGVKKTRGAITPAVTPKGMYARFDDPLSIPVRERQALTNPGGRRSIETYLNNRYKPRTVDLNIGEGFTRGIQTTMRNNKLLNDAKVMLPRPPESSIIRGPQLKSTEGLRVFPVGRNLHDKPGVPAFGPSVALGPNSPQAPARTYAHIGIDTDGDYAVNPLQKAYANTTPTGNDRVAGLASVIRPGTDQPSARDAIKRLTELKKGPVPKTREDILTINRKIREARKSQTTGDLYTTADYTAEALRKNQKVNKLPGGPHYLKGTKALESMDDVKKLGWPNDYEALVEKLRPDDPRVTQHYAGIGHKGMIYPTKYAPLNGELQQTWLNRKNTLKDTLLQNKELAGRNEWDYDLDNHLMYNTMFE